MLDYYRCYYYRCYYYRCFLVDSAIQRSIEGMPAYAFNGPITWPCAPTCHASANGDGIYSTS